MKVVFDLQGSPIGAESLWATKVWADKYRLENSPLYVYGYSLGDIVAVTEQEGVLMVSGPSARGGHSTYRVFLEAGVEISSSVFVAYWTQLASLGCTYEGARGRLLAIDVPPSADIASVYSILENGEATGVWEFEEGHCGHPIA